MHSTCDEVKKAMPKTPKFLKEVPRDSITKDALFRLKHLVEQYKLTETDIKEMELALAREKEYFNKLSQEEIPTLLSTYGLSEIKLESGEKVVVKENASVSVPAEKEQAFYDFLKNRDEEDIIKLHFHFARMPTEKMTGLFGFLTEQEYDYDSDRGVHSQTLKKYFKELLGIGVDRIDREKGVAEDRYLRKEDVIDIANVFTFFSTKIK